MGYTNSPLVNYTKISPNRTIPRSYKITRVTVHCYVGQATVYDMGAWFAQSTTQASCNYGIDRDGKVALIVEEKDRSWCSSNRDNDHRSITIEVASERANPYAVTSAAYDKLIDLLTDICKRNGKKKLLWFGDKQKTLDYKPANDEMVMTVHRWFAAKECPGKYLYDRHRQIADTVTKRLGGTVEKPVVDTTQKDNAKTIWKFFKSRGLNDYAVAGIMGNLRAESALSPINMQDSFEPKLGYHDSSYTKAVDNGSYNNFLYDGCGYGLAQWTYWSRKEALLNYAKLHKKSIGDLHMQLDFLWSEMQNYKNLMDVLKNATSVRQASNAMLFDFEKPGDMGTAQQNKRANYALEYYNQFAGKEAVKPEPDKEDTGKLYKVQTGAFTQKDNAEKQLKLLKEKGFEDCIFVRNDNVYRVQVGAYSKKENAEKRLEQVKKAGFSDAFITT